MLNLQSNYLNAFYCPRAASVLAESANNLFFHLFPLPSPLSPLPIYRIIVLFIYVFIYNSLVCSHACVNFRSSLH